MRAAADAMPADAPARGAPRDRAGHASPQRALRRPRLAWALIAEPVDPLRRRRAAGLPRALRELIADGLRGRDRGRRAARAERRADRRGAGRRLRRGAGRAAVAAGRGRARAPSEIVEALRTFVRRAVAVRTRRREPTPVRVERDGPVTTVLLVAAASGATPSTGRRPRRWPTPSARSTPTRTPPSRCCTARAACSAPAPT